MKIASLLSVVLASVLLPVDGNAAEPSTKVNTLLTKALVGVDGQEAAMITVELAPGADSPPHRHNANTFVYVLHGTVVMQVKGGEQVTLRAGETFYEAPTDIHTVSRNASNSVPAKLLVVLVKASGTPLTVPVK
jgi:quercetin dioxygenase-like cupin family protein